MGKKSHLSIENQLFVYKAIMKPIWSHGTELWGCASKSNIVIMQRSQSTILRATANATPVCNKSYSTYRLHHLLRR